jgi:hypothetical protein
VKLVVHGESGQWHAFDALAGPSAISVLCYSPAPVHRERRLRLRLKSYERLGLFADALSLRSV